MSVFYDNYVRLCALNNLSESGAAKKVGLSNAAANGWKNGKMPSAITQIKLANLFGISPGELMGAPAIPPEGVKKAPTETSERENNNPVTQEIFEFVRSASVEELAEVVRYIQFLKIKRVAK